MKKLLPLLVCLAAALAAAEQERAQVSGLRAEFRHGQTFLTWREPEPSASYRVYRATKPFTAVEQLTDAALLATVREHSSLNLMVSIDRMALSRVPREDAYVIPQRHFFVIADGAAPLDDATGLFVHTAKADETAFYAVTAMYDGAEWRTLEDNVVAAGLAERVEPVSAVAQNESGDYVHWTDHGGTAQYPAMAETPGGYFNFRVHGSRTGAPRALIGVLHGALFQFNTPDRDRYAKLDGAEGDRAVRVALDQPLLRGRIKGIDLEKLGLASPTGGNAGGGGRMPSGWQGAETRVLWTLDWVASRYPVDRDRYALRGESMGGMGSIAIAFNNPDRFAAFHSYVPVFGTEQGAGTGVAAMMRFNAYDAVKRSPGRDFPFIAVTAGRADHIVGWDDKVEFARFANAQRLGFAFYWDAREHAYENVAKYTPVWGEPNGKATIDLTRFSLRESYPAISNLSANDDLGTRNPLAVRPAERAPLDAPGMGELGGTINGQADWGKVVDESTRYEITLWLTDVSRYERATADIIPRRSQRFRPQPGTTCSYSVREGDKIVATGSAIVDMHGRVEINAVPLTRVGTRLMIEVR